jgi:hypothetical protein
VQDHGDRHDGEHAAGRDSLGAADECVAGIGEPSAAQVGGDEPTAKRFEYPLAMIGSTAPACVDQVANQHADEQRHPEIAVGHRARINHLRQVACRRPPTRRPVPIALPQPLGQPVHPRRTTRWATRPSDRKVVREEANLLRCGWPSQVPPTNVLRTDIRRLRERISPLGLEIVAIRRVGDPLQDRTAPRSFKRL